MHPAARTLSAFSLVELSIVLVILGLLVGGVLAGQSLIRAAELRSITNDYSRWLTAKQTFRDKYFALPGDMPNATQFWGVAHATPSVCFTTASTGTATCNGNGNGVIDDIYTYGGSNEQFRFWQHLANAGLIEGTYTGAEGSVGNGYDAIIGTNIPKSRLSNAGWSLISASYPGGQPEIFAAIYEGALFFGSNNGLYYTSNPVLSSQEAWNIDTKIDDGMAYTGKIWATSRQSCTNSASAFDKSSAYLLTATGIVCSLVFVQ